MSGNDSKTAGFLPGILWNTLPKSGSMYVFRNLIRGLKIKKMNIIEGRFPDLSVVPGSVKILAEGNGISHSHFAPGGSNLEILQNSGIGKIIVHVRDPRQALLSWVHYIIKLHKKSDPQLEGLDILPPDDVFADGFEAMIAWHIKNYFPILVQWIDDWCEAGKDSRWNFKILFTKYSDLKSRPHLFFKQIFEFMGIDEANFSIELPGKESIENGAFHFRKGEIDEWKAVLSEKQKQECLRMIPEHLFEVYGWGR